MDQRNEHSSQYQEWLNGLDKTVREAYEDRCGGDELQTIYERLKEKWEQARNPDELLTSKLTIKDIADILDAELAEIRAEATRLETVHDPLQQDLFPEDAARAKETREKELADRLVVVNLIQNEVTNKFHGILSKNIPISQVAELIKKGDQGKIENRGHIVTYDRLDKLLKISDKEGFDVFIAGLDAIADVKSGGKKKLQRELRQTAAVLFDRMMIAAAEAGIREPRGGFSLKTYMAERGLSDEKSLRQQVERDLDIIFGSSINWVGRGKSGDFRNLRIIGDKGIKNGIVFYEFTRGFFDVLLSNKSTRLLYMQFPVVLLRAANAKANPWAYFLGRRAALHRHMNRGQSNENVIGISTLLAACPDFPTLEEVMATTRDVTRRMIEPFERDMDAQTEAYTWEYQDGGKRPNSGKAFMAANVIIKWKDNPELAPPKPAPKKTTKKGGVTNS